MPEKLTVSPLSSQGSSYSGCLQACATHCFCGHALQELMRQQLRWKEIRYVDDRSILPSPAAPVRTLANLDKSISLCISWDHPSSINARFGIFNHILFRTPGSILN